MPKQGSDKLNTLLARLLPAEKRAFRLQVNRDQNTAGKKYVQLFDFLMKNSKASDAEILAGNASIKKAQLSNLKASLYKQVLGCLRLIERKRVPEMQLREQLDFAKILYEKGLYKQCLEILDKAKRQASAINFESHLMAILYFEKRVESQHVTGSTYKKADELVKESNAILRNVEITNQLSNASLLLYGRYLRNGYVKNKEDFEELKSYFKSLIPEVEESKLKFFQRLYLYQSYVWFYNMAQDFPMCFKYSRKWAQLFDEYEEERYANTSLYLKGIHNYLNALFMTGQRERFGKNYQRLIDFDIQSKPNVTENDLSLYHLFGFVHLLNSIIINASYSEPSEALISYEEVLADNRYNWDVHRVLVFNYKLACVYFGMDDFDKALDYLNKITHEKHPDLRSDIQSFARVLSVLAHYELGNDELVGYQLRSLYRYLAKQEELGQVQKTIIKFLKRRPGLSRAELKKELLALKNDLEQIETRKYEKRPFLYLDIISWLEAKNTDRSIGEVIKEKLQKLE